MTDRSLIITVLMTFVPFVILMQILPQDVRPEIFIFSLLGIYAIEVAALELYLKFRK